MAALIALWQWFVHHWDIVTIAIVFVACLGLLIWRDVSRQKATNHKQLPDSPAKNAVKGLGDSEIERLRNECEEARQAVSQLRLENDRLHQHRIDLMGSQIVDLKSQSTQANAPPPALPEEPDLRVDYRKLPERERGALIFRIRSGPPTTICRIGPVISEQTYRTESELVRLTDFIPDIEVGHDAECRILSRTLEQVLEAGGPTVSDSIVVDYTANNSRLSRNFFLYKNADGSIVWSTQDRKVPPKDLQDIRKLLGSLGQSLYDLVYAGQLKAMALECEAMQAQLIKILETRTTTELDLSTPMMRRIIFLDDAETTVPCWERLRLMSFRDRYQQYLGRFEELSLGAVIPRIPTLPNDMQAAALIGSMSQQAAAILALSENFRDRYAAIWFVIPANATSSTMPHT